MFGVTILGNNSALPAFDRHPTAQVVTMDDQLFLVDCGEGTQVQLSRYKIRWGRINYIFISHLHGDHYFGLPGLVNSMGLLSREQELHIFAPAELEQIILLQLKAANATLNYPLIFHAIEQEGELVRTERSRVSCFPTKHRIPCWGFRFDEIRQPRRVNPEKAIARGVPATFFDELKTGADYISTDGKLVLNADVTEATPKPKSYAYSADTIYDEEIIPKVEGVDLLYHETTYLKEMDYRAAARFHSTTHQAARIAKKAGAGRLLIGHFSSKYEKLDIFQQEAREVFADTHLALEGVTYPVY